MCGFLCDISFVYRLRLGTIPDYNILDSPFYLEVPDAGNKKYIFHLFSSKIKLSSVFLIHYIRQCHLQ